MKRKAVLAAGLFVLCFVLILALTLSTGLSPKSGVGSVEPLADGSTLELHTVAFTNRNYFFQYQSGSKWQKLLLKISPLFLRRRLPFSLPSSGFGFGIQDDGTNLVVITVNRNTSRGNWNSPLQRLAVVDEQGNSYDAAWGANTSLFGGETVHGWLARAFPRRSPTLGLRLISNENGEWKTAAEFVIKNPAYADYPQWQPEPIPVTRPSGDLAVTLKEFQSGVPLESGASGEEKAIPRATRALFEFSQAGRPAKHWTVQKLVLSDATGNHWFPYLEYQGRLARVEGGGVMFFGALWPGEKAWKLDVELVRTNGFTDDELWTTAPIALPAPGLVDTNLDAAFARDGVTVRLAGLGAPEAEHAEPFRWTAKYWGGDKARVFTLAIKIEPALQQRRLTLLNIVDDQERAVNIVQHQSQDYAEQAVFLKPETDARQVRFTFALQQSRFAQFVARPEFVDTNAARRVEPR